jgi:hypothetical protein
MICSKSTGRTVVTLEKPFALALALLLTPPPTTVKAQQKTHAAFSLL